jgi:hypothetical protein
VDVDVPAAWEGLVALAGVAVRPADGGDLAAVSGQQGDGDEEDDMEPEERHCQGKWTTP